MLANAFTAARIQVKMRMKVQGIVGGVAAGVVVCTLSLAGSFAVDTHAAPTQAKVPTWLTFNAKAKTASLLLISGYNSNLSGFNFDGYGNGKMTVTVPLGYKVTVTFTNQAASAHSAVIAPYADKTTSGSIKPAFSGATSPDAVSGTPSGKTVKFTFVAKPAGTYVIVCAVPGHNLIGMWDVFKVAASGQPSIAFSK